MLKRKRVKKESGPKRPDLKKETDLGKLYAALGKQFCIDFQVSFLPTGSFALDYIWCGGLPQGRITEIASPPGMGKTTLVIHILQTLCSLGHVCLFLDAEHAISDNLVTSSRLMQYYKKTFHYVEITTYDDADYILEQYIHPERERRPVVVVIDSISSLQTVAQSDEGHHHIKIGGDSKPCGDFLRKWKSRFSLTKTALILINQCRENINTNTRFRQPSAVKLGGNAKLKPWGGQALRHWTDCRTWLDDNGSILSDPEDPDSVIGRDLEVRCSKNKQGPMRRGQLSLIFGRGVSSARTLTHWLMDAELVNQTGAWFTPIESLNPEGVKFHGQARLEEWISANHESLIGLLKAGGYLDATTGM